MKERILYGWTPIRAMYVIIGMVLLVQAALAKEWPGILFGGYFAAMGVFRFGCAAGNCGYEPRRRTFTPPSKPVTDVVYEEVN